MFVKNCSAKNKKIFEFGLVQPGSKWKFAKFLAERVRRERRILQKLRNLRELRKNAIFEKNRS